MLTKCSALAGLALLSLITQVTAHPGVPLIERETTVTNPDNGPTNGQVCGIQNANARCDSGWCCGPDGICGQGGYYCAGPASQFQFSSSSDANIVPAGPDTDNILRPRFGHVPYGSIITSCYDPGVVALTFDDGPHQYTEELLDYLKRMKVNATFFVTGGSGGKGSIGDPSNQYYNDISRMLAEGHQIASHTWTHQDLSLVGHDYRLAQVLKNERAIANNIGLVPTYIRPPYLSCDDACQTDLSNLGYHVVHIDLDTNDWMMNYTAAVDYYDNGMNKDPAIYGWNVLAHDIHAYTVRQLVPYMVEKLFARGYKPVTIGECLHDDPKNWYRHPVTGEAAGPARAAGILPVKSGSPSSTAQSCQPTGTVRTDGRCGKDFEGAVCGKGLCCSEWGWCNADTGCGTGCQVGFGACDNTLYPCSAISGSMSSSRPTSTSSVANCQPTGTTRTDGRCGKDFDGAVCGTGYCCSQWGYCDNTAKFCGSGCQIGFGLCTGHVYSCVASASPVSSTYSSSFATSTSLSRSAGSESKSVSISRPASSSPVSSSASISISVISPSASPPAISSSVKPSSSALLSPAPSSISPSSSAASSSASLAATPSAQPSSSIAVSSVVPSFSSSNKATSSVLSSSIIDPSSSSTLNPSASHISSIAASPSVSATIQSSSIAASSVLGSSSIKLSSSLDGSLAYSSIIASSIQKSSSLPASAAYSSSALSSSAIVSAVLSPVAALSSSSSLLPNSPAASSAATSSSINPSSSFGSSLTPSSTLSSPAQRSSSVASSSAYSSVVSSSAIGVSSSSVAAASSSLQHSASGSLVASVSLASASSSIVRSSAASSEAASSISKFASSSEIRSDVKSSSAQQSMSSSLVASAAASGSTAVGASSSVSFTVSSALEASAASSPASARAASSVSIVLSASASSPSEAAKSPSAVSSQVAASVPASKQSSLLAPASSSRSSAAASSLVLSASARASSFGASSVRPSTVRASSAPASVRQASARPSSARPSARPSPSAQPKYSPNGTCGGQSGYTCPSGKCCSQYGYCGVSKEYCAAGCQKQFGGCYSQEGPVASGKISTDFTCGGANGLTCPGSYCCSQYGWCGKSRDYCQSGCQKLFGKCW